MRTISYRVEDLRSAVIGIGFAGENEHTQVRIDCAGVFAEYPTAVPAMAIVPPAGEAYPKTVERSGDTVIWTVTDSDLTAEGSGEMQLSFVVGEMVAKSYIAQICVKRSIIATGEEPEPIEDWLTEANATLASIPGTIDAAVDEALAEAKASGEFDGPPGADGQDGAPGADGYSPSASVSKSGSTATITITDKNGTTTATVSDGTDGAAGQDGAPGADGYSPTATVTKSGSTATITITDKNGTTTATVSDGEGADIIDDTAGSGDTDKTWSADKLSGLNSAINSKQDSPASGASAGKVLGLVEDNNELKPSWVSQPSVPVTDVKVNNVSVLNQGVANVPLATSSTPGVVKVDSNYGTAMRSSPYEDTLVVARASDAAVKIGSHNYSPIVPTTQHMATFYGLAKASGDTTQSSSSNAVGVYTETAKSKISEMLDAPETVSGSTPSITAKAGVRYICGECSTLTITVPTSGCIDVRFESGSTATVLTITPPTGQTVKWANGFDPTSLEANTTYELNIMDLMGVAGAWT